MLVLGISISLFLQTTGAVAANTITLQYGPIQKAMPVTELQAFAQSGQPSDLIKQLLQLSNQKPEQVQKLLTQNIPISSVTMGRLVNSYIGGVILGQVGQIILPAGGWRSGKGPANRLNHSSPIQPSFSFESDSELSLRYHHQRSESDGDLSAS
ncbi:hypothetical protein DO97_09465 [Neosynechococcus sphagnicola sy1]|uniref:DUF1400 domain-containing protein n=1 Tax=Neosynechococcus sphagnicola sy1 TaxID=1497020 RepID=A0A098TJG8_9CYAN|nr:hypothetical protein DO97_09465 [Neosynechococcus sphagnicola sy1]